MSQGNVVGRIEDPIEDARALLRADLERFQTFLSEALEPQKDYLSEAEYQLYDRGKKLRPMMLLLCARLVAGADPVADVSGVEAPGGSLLDDKVIKASVSLEMLHVATLIHDDIVDAAPLRRGLRSTYADRGTEMAVLVGDMQFIQAVRCFADAVETEKDMNLVRLILDVGFRICCGELDEVMTDPTWEPKVLRERYFQTIDRKTAILFGLACEAGATLVNARSRVIFLLSRYGRCFGQAFQIMDDLLDFVHADDEAGKLRGTDLAQGRLSLPILYALEELPADHAIHRLVLKKDRLKEDLLNDDIDDETLRRTIDDIVLSQGFVKAYSEARELATKAIDYLSPFPPSPYREALRALAEHVINRPVVHRPPGQRRREAKPDQGELA